MLGYLQGIVPTGYIIVTDIVVTREYWICTSYFKSLK
jgi:hypothetical protein